MLTCSTTPDQIASELKNCAKDKDTPPCTSRTCLPTLFVIKAADTRPGHLPTFHRPDLYAESVDRRAGVGAAGLGASGDGVRIGVSE